MIVISRILSKIQFFAIYCIPGTLCVCDTSSVILRNNTYLHLVGAVRSQTLIINHLKYIVWQEITPPPPAVVFHIFRPVRNAQLIETLTIYSGMRPLEGSKLALNVALLWFICCNFGDDDIRYIAAYAGHWAGDAYVWPDWCWAPWAWHHVVGRRWERIVNRRPLVSVYLLLSPDVCTAYGCLTYTHISMKRRKMVQASTQKQIYRATWIFHCANWDIECTPSRARIRFNLSMRVSEPVDPIQCTGTVFPKTTPQLQWDVQ